MHNKLESLIQTKWQRIFWLLLLMVLGYAMRWQYFQGYYYNPDEILHLNIAKPNSLWKIWEYGRNETHPPLGHFIRHFWMWLGNDYGENVSYQRHLSILFGLLTIPLGYLLGKEVFDRKAGVVAAFIICFVHHSIIHSAVVRNYTIAEFFALAALIFLFRFQRNNEHKNALLFIIFSSLATTAAFLYLTLFFAFALVWCIFFLHKKNYKSMFVTGFISLPCAILCITFYVIQYPYFSHYMASTNEYRLNNVLSSGSELAYAINSFSTGFGLIPNALMPYEFYYSTALLTPNDAVCVGTAFIFTLFLFIYGSIVIWRRGITRQQLYILACLVPCLVIGAMIYTHGHSLVATPRRWSILSLPIILIFSYAVVKLCSKAVAFLLIFTIFVSFYWNMKSQEMVMHETTWKKIKEIDLAAELHHKPFVVYSSSVPLIQFSALLKDKNIYEFVPFDERDKNSSSVPFKKSKLYYRQLPFAFTEAMNLEAVNKAFETAIKTMKEQKPYFVFLLTRWELSTSGVVGDILFCYKDIPGSKILLREPENVLPSLIDVFLIAIPYNVMEDIFIRKTTKCAGEYSVYLTN